MADDNRTEQATPRRREKAREKGQLLRTREFPAALATLAMIMVVAWHPLVWRDQWRGLLRYAVEASLSGNIESLTPVIRSTAVLVGLWVIPPMVLAWLVAVGTSVAQGGFNLAPAALQPKINKLNPVTNLGKLFSLAGLTNLLKSLIPAGVIVYMAVGIIAREWNHLLSATGASPRMSLAWLLGLIFEVAWKCSMVFLGWSLADYIMQRMNFERGMRMTKQEVRDEHKEVEGNPESKMRIRREMRRMQRKVLIQNVKKATVVITNPTHYAVALEYRPESMEAPMVVAKGRNLLAKKIREEALWASIPIIENPPLAQALYRAVEVGQAIPSKLYEAVAEILAFIFRAQGRAAARGAVLRRQGQPSVPTSQPSSPGRVS